MSDLPPTPLLVLILIAEIAIGIAVVAVPGFLVGWFWGS